jgi:predicted O-methyltransferase YrrM
MAKEAQKIWVDVDHYFVRALHLSDPILDAARQANAEAELPAIDVAPNQGKLLYLLAKLIRAEKILEIGTLGGYSTIWLARALAAGGRLISLEFSKRHADIARSNIERAGLSDRVEIRVAAALDSLPFLQREAKAPFDFVFIDADKPNNPAYLEWAIKLSRPGTLIIVDNVVRDGLIADAASDDPAIRNTRRMFDLMAQDSRISSTALQTVGCKGYDGFAMAVVNGEG